MSKTFFSKREQMYHYVASSDYDGGLVRSTNSSVSGSDVYSYATKVAIFNKKTEKLIYTGHNYSQTTTASLHELRRAFDHYRRLKVYDFTIDEAVSRLKESLKIHQNNPATRKPDKEWFIDTVYSLENLIEFYNKGKKYLNMSFYKEALKISEKYREELIEKQNRLEANRAKRREKEEKERQERIERTIAIVKEYNPNIDEEPKTFRECLQNTDIKVPEAWLKETHPELFDGGVFTRTVNFHRPFNYELREYEDFYSFRRDIDNCKLMRKISRWGGSYGCSPDILVYDKVTKTLNTSRHCSVNDNAGHVKKLLGLFLEAIDKGKDVSFVVGKHCGPYEIREYNTAERFLRVGCHCFLLENLREVYQDMLSEYCEEYKNKTCWSNYITMKGE